MLDVIKNINRIYDKRRAALIALSKAYAARAVQLFKDMQGNEEFWENQTFQAKDSVFGDSIDEADFVGFFLAHGKDYGVYLELANDRQNEALRPIINALWPDYIKDVKRIYV
jgi:hypothetical protein